MIRKLNDVLPGVRRPYRLEDLQYVWEGMSTVLAASEDNKPRIFSGFDIKGDNTFSKGVIGYNGQLYYHPDTAGYIIPVGSTVYAGSVPSEDDKRVFEDNSVQPFYFYQMLSTSNLGIPIGAFTAANVEAWRVFGDVPDGSITTAKLADGAVNSAKLAVSAVTSNHLFPGAVTEGKLANLSVTTGKLAEGAITGRKIANNTIASNNLAASAVSTAKIADRNVTNEKLATGVFRGCIYAGLSGYDRTVYPVWNPKNVTASIRDMGAGSIAFDFNGSSSVLPLGDAIPIFNISTERDQQPVVIKALSQITSGFMLTLRNLDGSVTDVTSRTFQFFFAVFSNATT